MQVFVAFLCCRPFISLSVLMLISSSSSGLSLWSFISPNKQICWLAQTPLLEWNAPNAPLSIFHSKLKLNLFENHFFFKIITIILKTCKAHISNQLVFNATFVPASLQSFRLNQANIFNCCFSVICVFDKQLYLLQEKFCVFVLDKVCQWFNL